MSKHLRRLLIAAIIVGSAASPASARTITIPVHWSVQKNELSIARLRLYVRPKLRKDVCAGYKNALNSGNTVKVVLYGAGGQMLTSFTYTKRDCT